MEKRNGIHIHFRFPFLCERKERNESNNVSKETNLNLVFTKKL